MPPEEVGEEDTLDDTHACTRNNAGFGRVEFEQAGETRFAEGAEESVHCSRGGGIKVIKVGDG